VVEGHGYNHEIARYLSRDEEDQVMKKAIAMIQKRTGRRCYGWRSCTQSTNTIELLSCRASRLVTARCSAIAMANTAIRITSCEPVWE
jgi:peptidoglycan/xylan/chitin deacetylase (PgdA/CDA1 family)